jgi:hypothetical protein
MNKNWDFDEDFPVIATQNPYVFGAGLFDICYLSQTCPFINAGLGYVEETPLIGQTTDIAQTPDSNKIDLGFHHSGWYYSNAGSTTLHADFDNSLQVDYNDLAFFMGYWLYDKAKDYEITYWDYDYNGRIDMIDLRAFTDYWLIAFDFNDFANFANQWQKEIDERFYDDRPDLNKDGRVDFKDFAVLADEWQKMGSPEPNIVLIISGDSNSGYVNIGASGFTSGTQRIFLLVDGKCVGEIFGFQDGDTIGMEVSESGNRQQQAQALLQVPAGFLYFSVSAALLLCRCR